MSKNKGNIEILLLLCCIVGVVAFFCFGLGITSLLIEPPDRSKLLEDLHRLEESKKQKHLLADDLVEQKKRLKQERDDELNRSAKGKALTETQWMEIEKELEELKKTRDRLSQEIEKRRKELASLGKLPDASTTKAKRETLLNLRKKLEDLQKKIREKMDLLPLADQENSPDSLADKESGLEKKLDKIRKRKGELEKKVNALSTKTLWGGASQFKNPLYVDCRKDGYIFYPKGVAVGATEIEDKGLFEEFAAGHDIIVLLVRPEGFERFEKAYTKAKTISPSISYEPVGNDTTLDFLRKEK